MSKGITFELQGSDLLQKILKNASQQIRDDISIELADAAANIAGKAKDRAPANKETGQGAVLKGGIGFSGSDLNWEVTSNARYSAYVEFGTGAYVFFGEPWVDNELRTYASQFKKGGDYRVYPQPFLFNTFFEERPKLIREIKKILKDNLSNGGRK